MISILKWYLDVWWKVMTRPILFYTRLPASPDERARRGGPAPDQGRGPAGEWWQEALTFVMINCGILGLGTTLMVFMNQYLTVGAGLLEGLTGVRLLIASPAIMVLAVVFFILTALIASGLFTLFFALAFGVLGVVLHFALRLGGGRGELSETVKASFYSSAIIVLGLAPILLAIFTKRGLFGFQELLVGEGLVYYSAALYLYGLWSIAGKKVHDVPRWEAFLAAALPFAIILLLGLVLNLKVLPKLEPWVT